MLFALRFRTREYLRSSLWVVPLAGAISGVLLALLTKQADTTLTVPTWLRYPPSTASSVLTTIVGASVGLTGFVVTVTVLAIQMATGTFSARYMRIWYRDHLLKLVLTALAGTLTLSFSLLHQVTAKRAPNVGVSVAGTFLVLSLVLFLLFFDRFIHRLRPVAVAALVGEVARRTLTTVTEAAETDAVSTPTGHGDPVLVVSSRSNGAVQAVDVPGLVRWADRRQCVLAMQIAVGDFVTTGQPLIAVYFGEQLPGRAPRQLQRMVALGVERTVEQDPAFAIRIMADVGVKALSAAINDPTTAVQALDQLEPVLHLLGSMSLRGPLTFSNSQGTPRLVMPGRTWEDYLTLAVTEIREYGCNSIQVLRRLRAMLEDLRRSVRAENRRAIEIEIAKLGPTITDGFTDSADKAQAQVADRQGIGGPAFRPFGTGADGERNTSPSRATSGP